jgi:2',3'-cyclic-nucleotide 2'-phosphodiesterase (5'-nucleotidase family)
MPPQYTLENFPSLRTLILEKRAEFEAIHGPGSKTVSVLTGDFLMPYLLSTVDKGRGMMAMLNGTPIDYLTWGNHEADMPHADVLAREKEYRGCWCGEAPSIALRRPFSLPPLPPLLSHPPTPLHADRVNTNMTAHESYATSTCQTDAAWIEVGSTNGAHKRKIGLIGIMTSSSNKPSHFNGAAAKIEDPWESMGRYKAKLEREGADVVVPLCHLYEPQDEHTAREFDFPVILSGHDHHVVNKARTTHARKPAHTQRVAGLSSDPAHTQRVAGLPSDPARTPRGPTYSPRTSRVRSWMVAGS